MQPLRRMRTLVLAGLILVPGALRAQNPEVRAERLRQELEQRFVSQMRQTMGLSPEQERRLREVMADYAQRRRALEVQERQMRQALNGQLRPGIAADPDSVTRLVDGIADVRVGYVQLLRDELRAVSDILTPVQRGQLFLFRDRILQRAQELRELRRGGPPPGGPGLGDPGDGLPPGAGG